VRAAFRNVRDSPSGFVNFFRGNVANICGTCTNPRAYWLVSLFSFFHSSPVAFLNAVC
jgi:hypothetical protein